MLVVNVLTISLGLRLLVGNVIRNHKLDIYSPGLPALLLVLVDSILPSPVFRTASSAAPDAQETIRAPVL